MTEYSYVPQSVCSRHISFELKDGKIHHLKFVGGCVGNLSAISKLLEGADAKKTSDLLRGNICPGKQTSCADQLAKAIDNVLNQAKTLKSV